MKAEGFVCRGLVVLLTISGAACGSGSDSGDATGEAAGGTLRVEHATTEGGAAVIRNLSGSRWGGDAVAHEELVIGVLEGDDEYMLARPTGLWLTEDEIFVLDSQENEVRVYDHEGVFQRRFGQAGQGPGEFEQAVALVGDGDGRLYIGGGMSSGRVSVYTLEGEHVEDWSLGQWNPAFQLYPTDDGVFAIKRPPPEPGSNFFDRSQSFQPIGSEGFVGDEIEIPMLGQGERLTVSFMGREQEMPIPGGPMATVYTMTRDGRVVVGFPSEYRFEIREPNTDETLVVERYWEPVPISERETEEMLDMMLGALRAQVPDIEIGDADFPEYRAAYGGLQAFPDDRIWVGRQGAGTREEGCETPEIRSPGQPVEPCWTHESFVDVFDLEGRFLGSVVGPGGEAVFPRAVLGDRIATIESDELDTPQVKIYRLVLPDEGAED